jgi:hypothetical protein
VEAAAVEVRKVVLLAVQAVLAAAVLVQVAQIRNLTQLLEPLTQVAVAVELVERNRGLAVQESSSFVIQIRLERWPLSAAVLQAQRERTHQAVRPTASIHLPLARAASLSNYGTLRIS